MNTTEVSEAILDKIAKCHILSQAAGTPDEAAAAAAMVQKLLFKHNITIASVTSHTTKQSTPYQSHTIDLGSKTEWLTAWKRSLLNGIATTNFCRMMYRTGTSYAELVGRDDNISAVKYLYEYLNSAIRRLCSEGYQTTEIASLRRRYAARGINKFQNQERKWRESFYYGAIAAVVERLRLQRREDVDAANANERSLVTTEDDAVEQAFRRLFPNLKEGKGRQFNSDGYAHGVIAGNRISLHKQVEG